MLVIDGCPVLFICEPLKEVVGARLDDNEPVLAKSERLDEGSEALPARVVAALFCLLLASAESMLAVDDRPAEILPADGVETAAVVFNDTDCILAL